MASAEQPDVILGAAKQAGAVHHSDKGVIELVANCKRNCIRYNMQKVQMQSFSASLGDQSTQAWFMLRLMSCHRLSKQTLQSFIPLC